jgi:hypothetical protein
MLDACAGRILDRAMTSREYDYRKKLRLQKIGDVEYVVKATDLENHIKKFGSFNQYSCPNICHMSKVFDAVFEAHTVTGHAASTRTHKNAAEKYKNIPETVCTLFCSLCPICVRGKTNLSRKATLKPIVSSAFNDRGQVDLIDMQSTPDGPYNWIMHYQDHLTKFSYLRALRKKS